MNRLSLGLLKTVDSRPLLKPKFVEISRTFACLALSKNGPDLSNSPNSLLRGRNHCFANGCAPTRNFSVDEWFQWQAGVFRSLSESTLVAEAQRCLVGFHEVTGLPWWATVIVTTFAIRFLLTFPLKVYQTKVLARYELLAPEIGDLAKELRRETAIAIKRYSWDNKYAALMYNKSLRKHTNALIVRDNCHPAKGTITIWIQIPLWVSVSVAWRNLAYGMPAASVGSPVLVMSLMQGGTAWFPNLVDVDHSFVLPVAFGLINLINLELETGGLKSRTTVQKVAKGIGRGIAVFMVPIAASMPACVSLYWATSSASALLQNAVLKLPRVRRTLGIPKTPSEGATPFRDVWSNLTRNKSRDA